MMALADCKPENFDVFCPDAVRGKPLCDESPNLIHATHIIGWCHLVEPGMSEE
jgi:hypothetical protein